MHMNLRACQRAVITSLTATGAHHAHRRTLFEITRGRVARLESGLSFDPDLAYYDRGRAVFAVDPANQRTMFFLDGFRILPAAELHRDWFEDPCNRGVNVVAPVKDRTLFALVERHGAALVEHRFQTGHIAETVLGRAVEHMLEELAPNLWEQRLERLADFGHSFSPAIERRALSALLHGEAVAIDMAVSTVIARNRGLLAPADAERALSALAAAGLPRRCASGDAPTLWRALEDTTRHRDARQRLPLLRGIGSGDVRQRRLARGGRARGGGLDGPRARGAPGGCMSAGAAPRPSLVFAVGGTSLRGGLSDAERDALSAVARSDTASCWTRPEATPREFLGRLRAHLRELARELPGSATPQAMALAFPGPIDANGRALALPTVLARRFPSRRRSARRSPRCGPTRRRWSPTTLRPPALPSGKEPTRTSAWSR